MGAGRKAKPRRTRIASDSVEDLASLWLRDPSSELARSAGAAMLRTARRNRVRIPTELRMRACRGCRKMLNTSNSRTRVRAGRIIVTCLECNRVHRYLGGVSNS